MKKQLKWLIPVLCVALLAAAGFGGYKIWRVNTVPTKIVHTITDSIIDESDARQLVAFYDYVFVGKIAETSDYNTNRAKREFPKGVMEDDYATTECIIDEIVNIKGNLKQDTSIIFYGGGGISKDHTAIVLPEEAKELPQVGKYYVFLGWCPQDDGVLRGMLLPLEDGITLKNLEDSATYQKYVNGVANEFVRKDIEHVFDNDTLYRSRYDTDYDTPGEKLPDRVVPTAPPAPGLQANTGAQNSAVK
ncbi:MAG: hypothetical protein LBN05_04425 [Oscillospiraceae bacterium]|jgi:hypothetical protein|nr:hypothetical protein [Oscillospiraceae bacterium]